MSHPAHLKVESDFKFISNEIHHPAAISLDHVVTLIPSASSVLWSPEWEHFFEKFDLLLHKKN